jgi:hypothetical protein
VVGQHVEVRLISGKSEQGIAPAKAAPFQLPEAGFDDDWRITLASGLKDIVHRGRTVGVDREYRVVVEKCVGDKRASLGRREEHVWKE